MSDASHELHLFADNTFDVVRGALDPIRRNLERKKNKGTYDSARAIDAFVYGADAAAKAYCREFGGTWHDIFPVADRRECAIAMRDDFESEIAAGNGWLAR